MLEEQLEASRKRAEQVVELEAEILKYCSQINELHIVCYSFIALTIDYTFFFKLLSLEFKVVKMMINILRVFCL